MPELFRSVRSVYGRVDIMVNNAGISEESQYAKMVAINLVSLDKIMYLKSWQWWTSGADPEKKSDRVPTII